MKLESETTTKWIQFKYLTLWVQDNASKKSSQTFELVSKLSDSGHCAHYFNNNKTSRNKFQAYTNSFSTISWQSYKTQLLILMKRESN